MNGDKPKKARGRPLNFKNKKVMQEKIDAYFAECDPHIATRPAMVFQKNTAGVELRKLPKVPGTEEYVTEQVPYTVTGLAMALNTSRETLINYTQIEEFFDTITCAKLKIHNFADKLLMTSKNPSGVQFSLKNNWSWVDKTEVEKSGTSDVSIVQVVSYAEVQDKDIL